MPSSSSYKWTTPRLLHKFRQDLIRPSSQHTHRYANSSLHIITLIHASSSQPNVKPHGSRSQTACLTLAKLGNPWESFYIRHWSSYIANLVASPNPQPIRTEDSMRQGGTVRRRIQSESGCVARKSPVASRDDSEPNRTEFDQSSPGATTLGGATALGDATERHSVAPFRTVSHHYLEHKIHLYEIKAFQIT